MRVFVCLDSLSSACILLRFRMSRLSFICRRAGRRCKWHLRLCVRCLDCSLNPKTLSLICRRTGRRCTCLCALFQLSLSSLSLSPLSLSLLSLSLTYTLTYQKSFTHTYNLSYEKSYTRTHTISQAGREEDIANGG